MVPQNERHSKTSILRQWFRVVQTQERILASPILNVLIFGPNSFGLTKKVVLYGCEKWSLVLRLKNMLKVLESRILRGIVRPKKQ